ncbi:response regulator [Arenibacter aquaticus]|uniref:Response regulator n=1 Tax=Arenibacter aquaticus TaxID=2489054 RepID=A0A3S0AYK9_9FLAO|nr:response regulator [Arenibacter aquaticus]RTE53352.1 response regulator [Arenibacter aquaticus]
MRTLTKICIVDDDDIYRFTIERTLESLEYSTKTMAFSDGEQAINFISDHLNEDAELPDIIFLDIDMPVMDGFQFMEEYEKIKSNVSKDMIIYMVSSSLDPVDIDSAKKISSISDYIVKPISSDRLKSILENLN